MNLQQDFQSDDYSLLNLINMSAQEREMVRGWRNHSETRKWMYSDHLITKKEHGSFIKQLQREMKNAFWVVKSKEYGYLGVVYLNRVDFNNRNAYLGLYRNPDSRHVGVGHHLLKCLKELAFGNLSLHTLKLEVFCDNKKAQKLYKGGGFTKEGALREFVRRTDGWKDVIIMGLVNSEER